MKTSTADGYWCESIVTSPNVGEWHLGGYEASSPRLAVRWLREQAVRVANALDPKPGLGSLPPGCLREVSPGTPNPGMIFREWAEDFPCQEKQMETLAAGRHIKVNAGGADRIFGLTDTDVFYSLSARPMSIKNPTGWRLREPCCLKAVIDQGDPASTPACLPKYPVTGD